MTENLPKPSELGPLPIESRASFSLTSTIDELLRKAVRPGEPRIYLALSGGGFRATAHHMGVLLAYLRFNQHQYLSMVCGVSGGAIAAGHFAKWWGDWLSRQEPEAGFNALRDFARPLVELMRSNLRRKILIRSPLTGMRQLFNHDASSSAEQLLDRYLFHERHLNKLMFPPLFIFTATDLASGRPFFLTPAGSGLRPHIIVEDYARSSRSASSAVDMPAARAVAVSAAFPVAFNAVPLAIRGEEVTDYWAALKNHARYLDEDPRHRLHLVDGGMSDNLGITFYTELITSSLFRGPLRNAPYVNKVMAYDASRERNFRLRSRIGRLAAFREGVEGVTAANETLNSRLLNALSGEVGTYCGAYRATPEMVADLGVEERILNILMKIRTDLDRLTDTEIYVLAYAGFRLAVYSLLNANLLFKDDSRSEREISAYLSEIDNQLYTDFARIFEGLLKPLPKQNWFQHLRGSVSRFAVVRSFQRAVPDYRAVLLTLQ